MSDKKLELSRRNMLAGLGTIGIASAGAGMGTSAYFNDPERIENNVVTAGELDLKLDWYWFYRGKRDEEFYQPLADDDDFKKPMFKLKDVKPGDWGCGVISIHVYDNPAYVWLKTSDIKNKENGQNEAEKETEGKDENGKGELAKNIKWVAAPLGCIDTTKDGHKKGREAAEDMAHTGGPVTLSDWSTDPDSSKKFCYYKGNLEDTLDHLRKGIPLTNKKSGKKFKKSHTCYIGFCWKIPKTVGNEIQSDSIEFDLDFRAVQYRHNSKNPNPWRKS